MSAFGKADWPQRSIAMQAVFYENGARPVDLAGEPDLANQCFFALGLSGEAGELANLFKKLWRGDFTLAQVKGSVAEEMADVAIYLVLLAHVCGVDLDAACAAKQAEVERRWTVPK